MDDRPLLATTFEEHRSRLTALAARMLGSRIDAEDAVQEAWIRFSRIDVHEIENVAAWLTTVVSRICLNVLQSRRSRSTAPLDELAEASLSREDADPEREALLSDSIGLALLIVLDSLSATERVAFVWHDLFAVPFEEIAPIVGRNVTATRQLASRARRRVQHCDLEGDPDRLRQSEIVEAFLSAARSGDLSRLVELLDPDVVLHADATAVAIGGPGEARGAAAVAAVLVRARGAVPALISGVPAAAWLPRGRLRVALLFSFGLDTITAVEVVGEPGHLGALDLVLAGEIPS